MKPKTGIDLSAKGAQEMITIYKKPVKKLYFNIIISFIFFLSTILLNCDNSDDVDNTENKPDKVTKLKTPAKSNFRFFLTDCPIKDKGIKSVIVTIKNIEIHSKKDGWHRLIDYGEEGRKFDLLLLQNGITADLGHFNINPGKYTHIRFNVTKDNFVTVKKNDTYKIVRLRIPFGKIFAIKCFRPFEIKEEGITSILLDFDAKKSIHYHRRKKFYWMLPIIKIIDVNTEEELSKEIIAETGGEIILFGEISIDIPPGALDEDTIITLKKIGTPYRMPFSSTYILSDYYQPGPDYLLLKEDMTITMNYSDDKIAEKNISEEDLKIYAIASTEGEWTALPGSANTVANTVTGTTNQLVTYGIGGPPADAPTIDPTEIVRASDENYTGEIPTKVKALISDPDGVASVTLSYRQFGALAFHTIDMTEIGDSWYEGTIPLDFFRDQLQPSTMEVYIQASDNNGDVSYAPVTAAITPHQYSYNPDLDIDGMNDAWEIEMNLDISYDDSQLDPDYDGYTNIEEYVNNTDPHVPQNVPDPEDIESVSYVIKENHLWNGDYFDFVKVETDNVVVPPSNHYDFEMTYDIDVTRFYLVTTTFVSYHYKTANITGNIGPMDYLPPSTYVRLYDDLHMIDYFYEEYPQNGYTEIWQPLPIYIELDINYNARAWNPQGASYDEDFYLFYEDN